MACYERNKHLFPPEPEKKKKVPKVEAKNLTEMKQSLHIHGIPYETEHRFYEYRKFRFDIAIMEGKIAIEYEGIFSEKSRHTNVNGYSVDAEKYNLAQSMGWRVYRYTAKNYKNMIEDLKTIMNF